MFCYEFRKFCFRLLAYKRWEKLWLGNTLFVLKTCFWKKITLTMDESSKKIRICKKNKNRAVTSKENLEKFSREDLIERVLQLEAHNFQLKSILQKNNELGNKTTDQKKKKINFNQVSKRHVLLKFYYFGWDYQGYVTQENTNNTVEDFLFKALEKCCLIENRETSNYHRCGRTDKGVSAFSQVISIDLRSKVKEPDENNVSEEFPYCTMLNRLLPDNIRCYSWCHVGSDTSARFNCSGRTYKYYFPKGNLNIKAMQEGAKYLVGTHDFRNLCKMDVGNGVTQFQKKIELVEIRSCDFIGKESSGFQMYEFIIQGNSFLWHQIRCIMSVLLLIGQEKESPDIIKQLLNINENLCKPQYNLASHLPLNLYDVDYENLPIKWNMDDQDLSKTILFLQSQWTNYSIKCTMIRDLIENLQKLRKNPLPIENQAESLQEGAQSKVYKPLLSRMKCESLESKINHYIKRRKIEVVEKNNTPD